MSDDKSEPRLAFDHMTVLHIRAAMEAQSSSTSQPDQQILEKHMTTAHLEAALSPPPPPQPTAPPQPPAHTKEK